MEENKQVRYSIIDLKTVVEMTELIMLAIVIGLQATAMININMWFIVLWLLCRNVVRMTIATIIAIFLTVGVAIINIFLNIFYKK